tara:strand:+ start:250 stop:1341 length:1092 start_codon:yes stop_codon:yes gene_type:complete
MKYIGFFVCLLAAASCAKGAAQTDSGETGQVALLEQAIEDATSEAGFSGVVLVADQGNLLFVKAFDPSGINQAVPVAEDSRFAIASMTKSFTAVLALRLVEQGRLSLEGSIKAYLPDYPADYADQVTIRQLLQNRSGIPHYVSIPGWFDNDFKRALTKESLLDVVSRLPLAFEPGSDYLYSNVNYYLLGLILEKVTGEPYETVLSDSILQPVGLSDTGQIYEEAPIPGLVDNYLRNDDGTYEPIPVVNPKLFRATASQYATASDLYRWSDALMGDALLSEESKSVMWAPEAPMAWTVSNWPTKEGEDMPFHTYNGELIGYTSMLTQFPDTAGTIIILNNNNAGYGQLSGMTVEIASHLYGSAE